MGYKVTLLGRARLERRLNAIPKVTKDLVKKDMEEFNSLPEDDDDDAAEYTWLPWWNLIKDWDRPILTAEGAIAAINLVNEETQDSCGSKIVEPLLNAVKKYLDKQTR